MEKVLIITYYWPPSGGSGVQRWMYFCKYLSEFGIKPIVVTVDEKKASYRYFDNTLNAFVENIEVHKTNTLEPLKLYSRLLSGNNTTAIPIGFAGESKPSLMGKISRAIRGNFFIPDARVGWVRYAVKEASRIIKKENIKLIITNGTPHSTHLAGFKLKKKFKITWIADFRDPWSDLHYNKHLYRTRLAQNIDRKLERKILKKADGILTIGPSMKDHLVEKGEINPEKVNFIYNGYDENDFKDIIIRPDPDFFTISHIGMLSDTQPITAFLKALNYFYEIKHPVLPFLKLRLIGNVSPNNISEVGRIIPELNFEHIEYVPKEKAITYMLSSDLLFNSLAEMKNSELLISGKLMEYIAAGKPILCLGNPKGDAANLLKDFTLSQVFERSDIDGIINFLQSVFENWLNNSKFAVNIEQIKQYSRFETTRQLSQILKKYL